LDDKAIEGSQELGFRIGTARIGETRMLEYRRANKTFESRVRMIAAPETVPRDETLIDNKSPLAGLLVSNLSPAVSEDIGFAAEATGVVVVDVKDPLAARLFKKGDIFYEVNGLEILSVADLMESIKIPQRRWDIGVLRDNRKLRLKFRE
jgi:hypothetical protein